MAWTVTYPGWLQTVRRTFPSRERAEQWVEQVGKAREATIEEVTP